MFVFLGQADFLFLLLWRRCFFSSFPRPTETAKQALCPLNVAFLRAIRTPILQGEREEDKAAPMPSQPRHRFLFPALSLSHGIDLLLFAVLSDLALILSGFSDFPVLLACLMGRRSGPSNVQLANARMCACV